MTLLDSPPSTNQLVNIAARLSLTAERVPDQVAVAEPIGRDARGGYRYRQVTFAELDHDTNQLAAGFEDMGMSHGMKIALLVKPGIDFVALTFALFKAGVTIVLIDPGMGRRNLLRALAEVQPDGFVAIPLVHMIRLLTRRRFPNAKLNVSVGLGWSWGVKSVRQLRHDGARRIAERGSFRCSPTSKDDPAAIIFTTGSTGPAKGVLYSHGNFDAQVDQIRDQYDIRPGGIDLSGFPLFALFNSAMGTTTVIPDMDPRRPAEVRPEAILQAMEDWQVTQAFGSPAIWNVVGRFCQTHNRRIATLTRVLSAGAPVPPRVLKWMKDAMPAAGDMHTPYGATESLPVATIAASEVLGETAQRSAVGAGTCVGRRFSGIEWRVIGITDEPINTIDDAIPLAQGQIGELIVRGAVVTRCYVTRVETNAIAKIADGPSFWHRMGDVGYLDDQERFWFCGRKAHRVETAQGTMFTIPCEAIFNQHPQVFRSALVGVGPRECQVPVMICEPWREHWPASATARRKLLGELAECGAQNKLTQAIQPAHILLHSQMPVDIRHNAKIFREKLAIWAADRLGRHARSADTKNSLQPPNAKRPTTSSRYTP